MSKLINLNDCFPLGRDGTRQALPKQRLFLEAALDENKYKSIRYIGGVGSGKTLIGVLTVLHWAVLYPGDYLIGRQHFPELRDTTYKNFLELCPPELIAEHRIADMLVKVRTVTGKLSTIFFRALDDSHKLRSLNLSGAYIDEANQVSEEAYMLLQGRLRGAGLRKIILTQNPGGHDWSWRWHKDKRHIADPRVAAQFVSFTAPSMENIHLPDGYIDTMLSTWSEDRIRRELMGDEDRFEGQIYDEFDRSTHVIKPFRIPAEWTRRVGMDDGYRAEAAWVYAAICPDGDVYIYREYYQKGKLVEEICKENRAMWTAGEKFEQAKMDHGAKQVKNGRNNWDTYLENLPPTFPMSEANKSVRAGIERVKSYLKKDARGKPRLYIFDTCVNLLDEIAQYRWAELPAGQQGKLNAKEEPVKNHDHAMDALRYVIMTCPEATVPKIDPLAKYPINSLERSVAKELQELRRPRFGRDPFGDS